MRANFRHSRASNTKVNILNWPKFELVREFMAVLITASLMTIRSQLNALSIGQCQTWAFLQHPRASKSDENSLMWLEVELIQDFMVVLVTCKIDEDWIKGEVAIVWTTLSPLSLWGKFHRSRASNSKEDSPIWPEIELIRDFIVVLVTCKFEEHPIKNKVAIDRTRSAIGFFGYQVQVTHLEVKSLIWSKFELIRTFMVVLVTCKFDEYPIKIECTIDRTTSNMGFFSTQGEVTLT